MTEEQLREKAFWSWYNESGYARKFHKSEVRVNLFLQKNIKPGFGNWLSIARKSLLLTIAECAARAQIHPETWKRLEESERKGTIHLGHLSRMAEILDCELVYAIRPKERKCFSQVVWSKIETEVFKNPLVHQGDPRHRLRRLVCLGLAKMNNPQFRKEQRWSTRKRF